MPVEIAFGEEGLVLPAELASIEARSFEGLPGIMWVSVPDRVAAIGERAFADCPGLWMVAVPSSVEFIDPTAFAGDAHLTLVCEPGSYAERFAADNGLHCMATLGG